MPRHTLDPTPEERGELGFYLWDIRKSHGWTLREAENKAKVSNAYINQIECGSILKPSPAILLKLSGAYKAPYKHLMELAGHLAKPDSSKGMRKGALPTSTLPDLDLTPDEENEVRKFVAFIRMRDKKKE